MKEIDLAYTYSYLFDPERCQVAYKKDDYMHPNDHGYYKDMSAYHDYEDDKCIVRHFDNPLRILLDKGFKFIIDDQAGYTRDDTITLSDVYKIMKENKPTKEKLYANIDKTKRKKKELMGDLYIAILNLKGNQLRTEDMVDVLFEIGDITKKNLFTREEFLKYLETGL